MKEKDEKVEIGFNEALRRIAVTPKSAVSDRELIISKDVSYNKEIEATKMPPRPAKQKA
jgi:hypothetical protein